jgi:ribonuclease VapC
LILDSSVVVAVISQETEADRLVQRIANARSVAIGAPTVAESQLVMLNKSGPNGAALVDRFLAEARILVVPFGKDHLSTFIEAFRRYGKGRHRAGLNMGDCFSYSIARVSGQPLLFLGDDFPHTDITAA